VERLRAWIARVAIAPTPGVLAETNVEVATEEAARCLWQRYVGLHLYTPGFNLGAIMRALEALVEGGWPAFEQCVIEMIRAWAVRRQYALHGEVWQIRYDTEERFTNRWLPAEDVTPVLVARPYMDATPIFPRTEELRATVPVSLEMTDQELEVAFRRQVAAARSLLWAREKSRGRGAGISPPAPYRGKSPGRKRDYVRMVELYNGYRERGEPKQIGRGLGGSQNDKRLLKLAIEWLRPVEIANVLAQEGVPTEGTLSLVLGPDQPNVVLWAGMSAEFVTVLERLQQAQVFDMESESEYSYYYDGGALNLPVLRDVPTQMLEEEHWVPVCFRLKDKAQ
jgi:hypothetical protein